MLPCACTLLPTLSLPCHSNLWALQVGVDAECLVEPGGMHDFLPYSDIMGGGHFWDALVLFIDNEIKKCLVPVSVK